MAQSRGALVTLLVVGDENTPLTSRGHLAILKADPGRIPQTATHAAPMPRSLRHAIVLYHLQIVAAGKVQQGVHVCRHALEMDDEKCPCAGRDPALHIRRIQGEGEGVDIGKNRNGPTAHNGHAGIGMHRGLDDDLIAPA